MKTDSTMHHIFVNEKQKKMEIKSKRVTQFSSCN